MITQSASLTEKVPGNGGEFDVVVNRHIGYGSVATITMNIRSCHGRHSTGLHMTEESARKLRDALSQSLNEGSL